MSDAKWTKTGYAGNSSFNIIRDGKEVNEKNVNHVIDNIDENLQYLFDEVWDLKRDKGAVILYSAPTDGGETFSSMLPGTPVYWVQKEDADTGGYWAPGQIDIRDAEDDESSDFFWTWDESSLAQGIVARRDSDAKTVDVCLYGRLDFDIYQDPDDDSYYILGVGDDLDSPDLYNAKPLGDAFVTGDENQPESFVDGVVGPSSLRGGVFYLSEVSGKLSPVSNYPRAMTVMIVDNTSDGYTLNTLVCPDGFGGEKFHVHEEFLLPNQCGYSADNSAIPDMWYPNVEDGTKYLNTAMGEIVVGSEVYPYGELSGTGTSDAEKAKILYDNTSTSKTGWLSADDSYFTGNSLYDGKIPVDAIWGYTIDLVDGFEPDDDSAIWSPLDIRPEDMFLIMDGMPIPRSHYTIDEAGIWWTAKGVEHAPIPELFFDTSSGIPEERIMHLCYISSLGEFKGKTVTDIDSEELITEIQQDGTAKVYTKDHFLTEVLTPAMTFNPFGGIQFANTTDVQSADPDKIITAEKAKEAIEYFGALTKTDSLRSCKEYTGNWGDLRTTGFYKITGATDGPVSSIETSPIGIVVASGYDVVQIEGGISESYMRKGRPVGTGSSIEWGSWMLITEKKHDPLYLQPSTTQDILHSTSISEDDLINFAGRTIVSVDESSNLVELPELTGDAREDGLDFRFMNEMNSGSQASTLVIKLNDQVSGYNGTYVVCPGQSCEEARHHMGQGIYTSADDGTVQGVPYYLDVQVTATYTDADKNIVVDDSDFNSGNVRYVKFECEAPQYYGSNSISLEVINGQWTVTGGSGIWWVLNEDEYDNYRDTSSNDDSVKDLLKTLLDRVEERSTLSGVETAKYQDNSKSSIKFTTRQIRTTVTGYDIPIIGQVDFSSSGGII